MSVGKNDIASNISSSAKISKETSKNILNSFINLVKKNTKNKTIKISGFGSFYYRKTPERLGRNPKTKEEFLISKRTKLFYTPSNKIKEQIN